MRFSKSGLVLLSSFIGLWAYGTDPKLNQELERPSPLVDLEVFTQEKLLIGERVEFTSFSPDNSQILVMTYDNGIFFIEASGGKILSHVLKGKSVVFAMFPPDGSHAFVGTYKDGLFIFDTSNGKVLSHIFHGKLVVNPMFSPDGSRFFITAYSNLDRGDYIIETSSGKILWNNFERMGSLYSVCFSPDASRLLIGTHLNGLNLVDNSSGMIQHFFEGKTVNSVMFSPDGSQILAGTYDGLQLVGASNGKILWHALEGNMVMSSAFSPDSSQLLVSGLSAFFLPDGSRGGYNHGLYILDASSGEVLYRLLKEQWVWVRSAVFSSDGSKILVGAAGLYILDASSGETQEYLLREEYVSSAIFSPDGSQILANTGTGLFLLKKGVSRMKKDVNGAIKTTANELGDGEVSE